MPQVFTDVNFTVCTLWVLSQHRIHHFLPTLIGVVGEDVSWLSAQLQQELGHAFNVIRITPQSELLTVQPGVRVSHHINQTTTLFFQAGSDWLTGDFADFHQEFIGPLQTHWDLGFRHFVLPGVGNKLGRFYQLVWLQHDGVECVWRIFHFILSGTTGIHTERTVCWGIEDFFWVRQQGEIDIHLFHHALDDAEVAQVSFETRNQVQLTV